MDASAIGLKFRPFATGPDPAGYFAAPAHDDAITRAVTALEHNEPYVAMVGEPGLGKTLAGHIVVSRLNNPVTAFITNCHCEKRSELLQAILYDFGLPYAGRGEQELRLSLTDFVMQHLTEGQRTLVVLDEAHLLNADLLEEVRLLGNLESPRGRAVQVLMLGLPSLLVTLNTPSLTGLSQRLATRIHLEPLGLRESAEYIAFQVNRAGGRPSELFNDDAIEELAKGCRGIPRLLNQAASAALALMRIAELETVDIEVAMEALATLPHAEPAAEPEPAPQLYSDDEPMDQIPVEHVVMDSGIGDLEWPRGPLTGPQRYIFTPVTPH